MIGHRAQECEIVRPDAVGCIEIHICLLGGKRRTAGGMGVDAGYAAVANTAGKALAFNEIKKNHSSLISVGIAVNVSFIKTNSTQLLSESTISVSFSQTDSK